MSEPSPPGVVALSWSGGKDSALALHLLRSERGITPKALVTTVTEDYGRVSMHGVRRELVRAQADAAGVPLVEIAIPAACPKTGRAYDESLLADLPAHVDPCGENGEFHTFVHAGPIFEQPIPIERGERVWREGFVFCDLTGRRWS